MRHSMFWIAGSAVVSVTAGLILGLLLGGSSPSHFENTGPAANLVVVDLSKLSPKEQDVARRLNLRAAFVRGTDLSLIGRFAGTSGSSKARLERQIYLIACLEARENTGPRVLSVSLEIMRPDYLAGCKVHLRGGLLENDCIFHIELMVDTDASLTGDPDYRSSSGEYIFSGNEGPSLREQIVKSSPEFRIVTLQTH